MVTQLGIYNSEYRKLLWFAYYHIAQDVVMFVTIAIQGEQEQDCIGRKLLYFTAMC